MDGDVLKLAMSGRRVLVIAEIGVNHDGRVDRALELVDHARAAGADAVKLQLFRAKELMHSSSSFAAYQQERCAEAGAQEMLRRYELRGEDEAKVVQRIRELRLTPLATPFSLSDVKRLAAMELPAVKIASPDLVNWPLLREVSKLKRPMLISTGAATMEEVQRAVAWLADWRAEFALLHCISSYPAAADQAHLGWVRELAQFGAPVGFSDHTTEDIAGALAVAAGAMIIEKHLTYDRAASGPDHSASADPAQFARYVAAIRLAERMRGGAGKRVLDIEQDVRRVSRQSLVLRCAVEANQAITEQDLTVQRPGTGIPAADYAKVMGRRAAKHLAAGTILTWDLLLS